MTSCQDARDLWLAECALGGASIYTISSYRALTTEALEHFARRHGVGAGEVDLAAVTRDDVVSAMSSYQARPDKRSGEVVTRSASSVASFYGALRSFFAWCVDSEKLTISPVQKVKAPKTKGRVPKALGLEDCQKLLGAAQNSRSPERDRLALLLGLGVGLRLGEMARLELGSFLPSLASPERLRVVGKGGKERVVPVPAPVREALASYLLVREAILVERGSSASTLFLAARSETDCLDVSREGLGEVFERLIVAAGIKEKGRRAHATRHSFATHVLSGGADITEVSELLGHASVATTQIYLKVDQAKLVAAVDNNAILGGGAA